MLISQPLAGVSPRTAQVTAAPAPSPSMIEPAPAASPNAVMVVVAIGNPQPTATTGALPEGTNSVDLTLTNAKLVTSAVPVTMTIGSPVASCAIGLVQLSPTLVP